MIAPLQNFITMLPTIDNAHADRGESMLFAFLEEKSFKTLPNIRVFSTPYGGGLITITAPPPPVVDIVTSIS